MPRFAAAILGLTLAAVAGLSADAPYADPPLSAADRAHWSFVPPVRPPLPAVKDAAWGRNPIDRFVLAKLDAAELAPSVAADRLTLIRRLSFDLTGLPPTPAEIDGFLADTSADAYEKLVERLLASSHYGERWGQHWLDAVRFAESNGYEADGDRPHAWRYRDYVVTSLNADLPYDRFVTEQLAGDLLGDKHVAAGYLRLGPVHIVSGNVDRDENRQEVLTEVVNNVGSALMGLTLGCTRCHDHKFDPLSQGDYYRVQAYFGGTFGHEISLLDDDGQKRLTEATKALNDAIAPVHRQIDALEAPVRATLHDQRIASLDAPTRAAFAGAEKDRTPVQKTLVKAAGPTLKVSWDEVVEALPPVERTRRAVLVSQRVKLRHEFDAKGLSPTVWTVKDQKSAVETRVLVRGSVKKPSTAVTPAVPRVTVSKPAAAKTRLDLAAELTRPDHPLTARVIVNRLWRHHFGRGIVNTPNDFGTRGDAPTHPELLDWLARELVAPTDGGKPWTLKRMHRLMVTSATYRQASVARAELAKADPDNKLLGRMPRRRLDAEALRDAVLTAAGTLNRAVGGPSVRVPLEPAVYDLIFSEDEPVGLWPVTADAKQHTRRSLYLFQKRNVRLPLLEAFDLPDTLNACAARGESTFAPQALILMNGPFTAEQSARMADDVTRVVGADAAKQIEAIFRRNYGRAARPEEVAACVVFLKAATLADLCKAVLNTSEFLSVP